MYNILESRGLPDKIVNLIENMYEGTNSKVRVSGRISPQFDVRTGVKQGALLSPLLFNTVLDHVMIETMRGCRGIWLDPHTHVTDLDYADDAALIADSVEDMQEMINRLVSAAHTAGLVLSVEKTKVMRSDTLPLDPITAFGRPLEDVDSFVYLGSRITINGSPGSEVLTRIAKAENSFSLLRDHLWNLRTVDTGTKIKVYMAAVRPVLLYGCETWPELTDNVNRLEAFEFRCWRRILNVSYLDRVTNAEILLRLNSPTTCLKELQKRRLTYLGHVLRMDSYRLSKRAFMSEATPSWSRQPGGQRKTWQMTIWNDVKPLHLQRVHRSWASDWKKIICDYCQNRTQWAAMVRQIIRAPV